MRQYLLAVLLLALAVVCNSYLFYKEAQGVVHLEIIKNNEILVKTKGFADIMTISPFSTIWRDGAYETVLLSPEDTEVQVRSEPDLLSYSGKPKTFSIVGVNQLMSMKIEGRSYENKIVTIYKVSSLHRSLKEKEGTILVGVYFFDLDKYSIEEEDESVRLISSECKITIRPTKGSYQEIYSNYNLLVFIPDNDQLSIFTELSCD